MMLNWAIKIEVRKVFPKRIGDSSLALRSFIDDRYYLACVNFRYNTKI